MFEKLKKHFYFSFVIPETRPDAVCPRGGNPVKTLYLLFKEQ